MQLKALLIAAGVALLWGPATAQSLSPMKHEGPTPSDIKGFRLTVGNPYAGRMAFVAVPMDVKFETVLEGVSVSPAEFRLAPGASRPVILKFRIDPALKERTVAVCIYPKDIEGPIQPRVCGTYTGRLFTAGG